MRIRFSYLATISTVALIVAGCATQRSSLDRLDEAGRSLVAQKCVSPISTEDQAIPNRHVDGVIDQIKSIHCPDYSIQVYISHAYKEPRELPMRLNLTAINKSIPARLNVGATAADVRTRLGQPMSESQNELVYSLSEAEDTLIFQISSGRVNEVDWSWDVD